MFGFPQIGQILRDPDGKIPPSPTPVTFPPCPSISGPCVSTPTLSHLEALFRVKHIKVLREEHLQSLNPEVLNHVPIEELVPKGYLPPTSWRERPAAAGADSDQEASGSNEMLSNGAAVPSHETFYNRMIELSYDSDEAYDALTRRHPLSDHSPVRLSQFRKFWSELQLVAKYWDSSQDNVDYDDPLVQQTIETQKKADRAKTQHDDPMLNDPLLQGSLSKSSLPTSRSQESGTPLPVAASPQEAEPNDDAESLSPLFTYTGRRFGTGRDMPHKHRDNMVQNFVEPIAWCFGCVLERTTMQPHLNVGTTRLMVDHAMRVFRGPQDRQRSRARILEGPLMALQCTHETEFAGVDPSAVDYIARELGALLLLAQERDREGRAEKAPGGGQWWVEKPRWGGGTGEALGSPLLEDDGTVPFEDAPTTEPRSSETADKRSRTTKRNFKKHLRARSHRPPTPVWEKRVKYLRIGKAPDEVFDTIYMLSALNHHFALVRLEVHPYLIGLFDHTRDTSMNEEAPVASTHLVRLSRSRWFDMFVAEDRVQLMSALWGVMGWMMRDTGKSDRPDTDAMNNEVTMADMRE